MNNENLQAFVQYNLQFILNINMSNKNLNSFVKYIFAIHLWIII
jgi:hypothetical protein